MKEIRDESGGGGADISWDLTCISKNTTFFLTKKGETNTGEALKTLFLVEQGMESEANLGANPTITFKEERTGFGCLDCVQGMSPGGTFQKPDRSDYGWNPPNPESLRSKTIC